MKSIGFHPFQHPPWNPCSEDRLQRFFSSLLFWLYTVHNVSLQPSGPAAGDNQHAIYNKFYAVNEAFDQCKYCLINGSTN
jgi:hypothetical protein